MLQLYIPVPSILGLIRRGIHDESEPGPPPDLSGQGGVTRYHFHRCLSTPIFPRMVGDLDRQEEQKQQEDHLEWISAAQAADHEDVCRKRLLTTGTWILETESFRNWKNGLSEPILWINGITGARRPYQLLEEHCTFDLPRPLVSAHRHTRSVPAATTKPLLKSL